MTPGPSDHVVVVGGGLAAARLCTTLRRKKHTGPITLVTAEAVAPYDRPPLSKDVLSGARDATPLPFDPVKLEVDLRTSTRATGLDVAGKVLHTDNGDIAWDQLVIATGAGPIRLPGVGEQVVLRTLEDALALRSRLTPGARVVLVGASWIGAEVATAARAAGCQVTVVEAGPAPFHGALGERVGHATRSWWEGVDLRTGVGVASVEDGHLALSDGTRIDADVIVVGVGVRPAVAWLDGSGIAMDRGVLTDTRTRTNVPGVLAIGDVAQRWSHRTGSHRLAEHWDEASTVAATAATVLTTAPEAQESVTEHDPVPYFWSDLFGRKVQYVGAHSETDTLNLQVDDDGALAGATWSRDGVLTAWLGVDAQARLVAARTAVGGPVEVLHAQA